MKITYNAKRRASKAIKILDKLRGHTGFDDARLSQRQYDSCFESGDGTMVVCEIMRQARQDQEVMRTLQRWPACDYVDLPGWTKTFEQAQTQEGATLL